ncbi:MAG: GntR family transcriptional regulator [Opitutaceae bacterium]|jgi:DNA-binding LacI/PurR family transcriptional regulator|nr:GntR family transcriptional regulator [Opitutaceae bacterium]
MNLYRQIAHLIVKDVQLGQLPPRLPSWRDLEQRYNVNRGSIEKAFMMLRAMGVVSNQSGRAYTYTPRQPADPPRLGVVAAIPTPDNFYTQFFEEVIFTLQAEIGPGLIVEYVNWEQLSEQAALQRFLQRGLDGVFSFPLMRHQQLLNLELYREFEIRSVRTVFLFRNVPEIQAPSVFYDPRGLFDAMIRRLKARGCTKIVDLGRSSHRFAADQGAAFRLFFEDGVNIFAANLPHMLSEKRGEAVDQIAAALAALPIHARQKIGMIASRDAHVHLADLAAQKLGFKRYEIVTDGLMRGLGFDVYGIKPAEVNPRFFDSARIDYRSKDIARAALQMMRAQLRGNFSCFYSMPFAPCWKKP